MENKVEGISTRVQLVSLVLIRAAKREALLELRRLTELEYAIKQKMDSNIVAEEDGKTVNGS